jgi:hypothetical protein
MQVTVFELDSPDIGRSNCNPNEQPELPRQYPPELAGLFLYLHEHTLLLPGLWTTGVTMTKPDLLI